jgi:hypothetical protein
VPAVAITQNNDIERAIYCALEHIQLEGLVRGKSAAVKPNDRSASKHHITGVTQDEDMVRLKSLWEEGKTRQSHVKS